MLYLLVALFTPLVLSSPTLAQSPASGPVLLYDVQFENPPHSLGMPPVVGEGSAPRNTPTRLRFGAPLIVAASGSGTGQALELAAAGDSYDQLVFALAHNHDNGGFEQQYPTYHFDLTVVIEAAGDADSGFTILFDGPMATQLAFTPAGTITAWVVGDPVNNVSGYVVEVGRYEVSVPIRLTVDLDMALHEWRIALDGESVFSGPNSSPCPVFLEAQCMRNLRLNATGTTRALVDDIVVMDRPLEVHIDIKPGLDPNPISLLADGLVPVAILGSDEFDVGDVDVNTLVFGPFGGGGAGVEHVHGSHLEDVNGNGFMDLLAHFQNTEIGVTHDDIKLCISGRTLTRIPFDRCDSIVTVP
jgi:hypothetical protein